MTIPRTSGEDVLMRFMSGCSEDSAVRDPASLDPARLLSSAKPTKIRQPQSCLFSGIGPVANAIIASTSILMTPSFSVACSDGDILADANGRWLCAFTQPTGMMPYAGPQVVGGAPFSPMTDRELHAHKRFLTASVAELSREALAALGISKTHMAAVLGIERPHFYQWLKDGVTNPVKSGRLRELLIVLSRTRITPQDPLRAHLLTEPLTPGGTPLLVQLEGDLNNPLLESDLRHAADINRTITRDGEKRIALMRDRKHDTNIDAVALDNLDTTLTLMDWSRHHG